MSGSLGVLPVTHFEQRIDIGSAFAVGTLAFLSGLCVSPAIRFISGSIFLSFKIAGIGALLLFPGSLATYVMAREGGSLPWRGDPVDDAQQRDGGKFLVFLGVALLNIGLVLGIAAAFALER